MGLDLTLRFEYRPRHLTGAVDKVISKFPADRELARVRRRDPAEIARLLQRLEHLPPEELDGFAASLVPRELWTLLYSLPGLEPGVLADRCAQVLHRRWRDRFGRALWQLLQAHPDHRHVQGLLAQAVGRETRFLPCAPERQVDVARALQSGDLVERMGELLAQGDGPYASQAIESGFEPDSALWRASWTACLRHGGRDTYLREDAAELARKIERLREPDFICVVDRYLQVVSLSAYANPIMTVFRHRLGLPYTNNKLTPKWEPISEASRQQFQRWWMQWEIERFFDQDNERHEFWREYLPHMTEVHLAQVVEGLIMVFHRMVIVEFAHKGNAAYVYHIDVFNRVFGSMTEAAAAKYASRLKDQDLCQQRIPHFTGWQWRTREFLQQHLKGG